MKIGVLCAMQKEYDLLYSKLHNRHMLANGILSATTHENGGHGLYVMKCGIGKVNAALSAQKLINYGVLNIISVGVAGGASTSVLVGDIVIGNSYCYHDVWCGEPNRNGQVQGFPAVFPSSFGKWLEKIKGDYVHLGTIATGDWFVQTRKKMESILSYLPKEYNVLAVDMESAAIAQVCYNENVPFMSVRVISDNPLLPEQHKQYDGFWDKMAEKSFDTLYNIIS